MIPLATLLPVAGTVLGGVGAYKQSGGDLGATALGSGLGALSLTGMAGPLRFAGGRLAGTPLLAKIAPEAAKAQAAAQALLSRGGLKGAQEAIKRVGLQAPLAQQMAGSQALSRGLTGLGAVGLAATLPGAASKMAADVAGPVRSGSGNLGQTALGTAALPRPGEVDYSGQGVPAGMDQYGNVVPYGSVTDVLAGGGLAQRLQFGKDVEATRDAMRLLNPEIFKAAEARSKTEFQRQMAAAGIRQNIATRAAMLQAAQQAGLGMGMTAAQQAGGALTSQYQYQ